MKQAWMKGAAAALAVAVLGYLVWGRSGGLPGLTALTGQGAGQGGWGMIRPDAASAALPAEPASQALTAEQVRARLFQQGSFKGTEPPGGWCVGAGRLTPCAELRKRFEYYFLGLGEVSVQDLRTLVEDEARRAHGEAQAVAIMAVWDRYWQLRSHAWRSVFVQSDPGTWRPAFEEQRLVRRQILGEDWARAFYADDEVRFKQLMAQVESGQPPAIDPGEPVPQMAPGKDPAAVHAERVARYGQAAADRLARADAEWADWERRLAAARNEWERLKASPQLSELQRKQDMDSHIQAHFQPDEQARVRALLHL
ncbi:MAG: hypothetical protein IIA02_15275 [Proteobacteria bacterium]|nr:hypothetical protein [Pseudomonadota bacterium]